MVEEFLRGRRERSVGVCVLGLVLLHPARGAGLGFRIAILCIFRAGLHSLRRVGGDCGVFGELCVCEEDLRGYQSGLIGFGDRTAVRSEDLLCVFPFGLGELLIPFSNVRLWEGKVQNGVHQ